MVDIWGLINTSFQNKFVCVYSGVKYRVFENFNKIGTVAFALSLGSNNDNNIQTRFGSGDLKTNISAKNSTYIF